MKFFKCHSFFAAHQRFLEILKEKDTIPAMIYRDSLIQRFKFTFETAWKALQEIGEANGITEQTPRQVIRLAAEKNIIQNPEEWLEMVDDRNRTSHIYNEEKINEIVPAITTKHSQTLAVFAQNVHNFLQNESEN